MRRPGSRESTSGSRSEKSRHGSCYLIPEASFSLFLVPYSPMAASTQEAVQRRIITHMNDDHQESIVFYLRNYAKLPPAQATSGKLETITEKGMAISYSSATGSAETFVEFDPPLSSLSEARPRLIAMLQDSMRSQGVSPIRIKRFAYPSLAGYISIIGASIGFYSFAAPGALAPDSVLTRYALLGNLKVAAWLTAWRLPLLAFMIAIHLSEAGAQYYFAWKHCPRKVGLLGLETLGIVGWIWVVFAFIEGFPCINRFKALVQTEDQKSKKH